MRKARRELNELGIRATHQRRLILEAIRNSRGHVDADEVYRRIQKKQARISLSTVYRTLQRFKELGMIDELHFNEAHHHYEMKPASEHHHLVCIHCGQVMEFRYPLAQSIKKNIAGARDFEITGSEVTLFGYCPDCQKDKQPQSGRAPQVREGQ